MLQEQQAFHVVQTSDTTSFKSLLTMQSSTIAPSIPPHLIVHASVLQQLLMKLKCEIPYTRARVVCSFDIHQLIV